MEVPEEGRERYGIAAAVSWMRARTRVLAKKRQQGVGFVSLDDDSDEDGISMSDAESSEKNEVNQVLSVHEQASMLARQDLQVSSGRSVEERELCKVWCVLKERRIQMAEGSRDGDADSAADGDTKPAEDGEAEQELGTWMTTEEEEDIYRDVEDSGETNVLVAFLQRSRMFRKTPASQLRWLADRLLPEEVDPCVQQASTDVKRLEVPDPGPGAGNDQSGAAGSFSSRLLQQARELGAVARSSPQLQCRAVLRVLVRGTVSWPGAEGLIYPGALIVDFGPFLPSWYSWRPNSKDPTMLSKSFMARAEIDQEFIDRLGAPFALAAERAASFFIATKSPTLRSVSDVAMMVQYLRHVPMLSQMSSETLEAVAFALELRDVQQNEVLTSHGEHPTAMLLSLSSVVSAWRRMPEGKVTSVHARLSEEAILRARGVLQGFESPPKRLSVSPRKSQSRGREFWICVDVTDKDDVVPHSEWAMAASCPCNVSLVAMRRGKAFSLSKADYQRHVQHHRVGIVLEVMAFLGRVLTPPDVLSQDLWWLEETPLARSPILRALPRDVRQRILCSGALRKLPSRSWLCREDDTLHACYLLISGELELSLPGTEQERRRLLPGVVFGDKMLCIESPEPGWASRYCAGGEDCWLYEVSRQSFEAALQLSEVTDPRVPEIEKALQIPFGARTFTQLQLLSSFLERQAQFSAVDAFARLEVSEFAELRKMSAGEAIPFSLQCSCCILHGKVSVLVREGDQQVHVCSLSAGSWLGEEFGMSGEFSILAARDCSLFWLDRSHLPQGRGSIIAIGGDKATDRASTDRGRAIQTLRFKAPEQRSPEDVALLAKLFHGNKFFDEQEESVLREICRSMSYVEVRRHQVIIKQGDVADMCYILLKGAVGIWVSRQDELNEEEDAKEEPEIPARTKEDEQDASPKTTKSMPQPAEKETEVEPSSVHATRKLQKAAVKLLVARRAVDDPAPQGINEDPNSEVDPATGGPIHATQVKELKEGDCFGETGLLHGARRNASIVAAEECQLGCISKALFESKLRAAYLAKEQARVNFLRDHLPRTLNGVDHAQVLGGFFSEQQVRRGHVLCVAGKPCERLTIIRDGLYKVRTSREGRAQEVGEIGRGQIIGLSTIGGMDVEPFTIVCASPEVAVFRMDLTDARNRIPTDLREAMATFGLQMVARMQRRADFLKAALSPSGDSIQVLTGLEDAEGRRSLSPKTLASRPKTRSQGHDAVPATARARTAPSAPKGEVHDAPHRRQLTRLMERQQREWEDLVITKPSQWSPNIVAEKQKEKERLKRQLHSRNIKTDRLLKENSTWQHERHLLLTRPDLCEKATCRRTSGEIKGGIFIPGAVRLGSNLPQPPQPEVLKATPKSTTPPPLQRVMVVAVSPSLRPPYLCEDDDNPDAFLCCRPMPVRPQVPSPSARARAGSTECDDGPGPESADVQEHTSMRDLNPFFVLHEQQYSVEEAQAEEAPMLLSAKASPKHQSADASMEESNEVIRPPCDTTRRPRPRAEPRGVATQRRPKLVRFRKGLCDVAMQQKLPSSHDGQQQIVLRKHYDPEASSVRFGAEEILLLESRNAEEEAWQRNLLEMHIEGRSSSSPVTPTTPGSVGLLRAEIGAAQDVAA